jgi:holo-[acyl-carrier protein] synthase
MKRRIGIGVDIEETKRFRLDRKKDASLLKKIFSEEELEYCFSKADPSQHLAARFAAKEAVVKALNDFGLEHRLILRRINIKKGKNDVPKAVIMDKIKRKASINISLSHSKGIAIAFAIVS